MKYAYHDLYDLQFERLVVEICHEILGPGIQEFASGPDGGRDAKFEGTAKDFPSDAQPYSGKFIIQAKHTENPTAKTSDAEFSGPGESSLISKEIVRLTKLSKAGEVEHYILFTNRRSPATPTVKVAERLRKESGVDSADLVGIERLERWLKTYPQAASRSEVTPFDAPLRVSPDELATVIQHFVDQKDEVATDVEEASRIRRTKLVEKNQVNGLSEAYATLIRKYIKDFGQIKTFLASPDNIALQVTYISAADEFQSAILSHWDDERTFDRVLDYLFQQLVDRDPDLAKQKRATRAVLYYMYWNCDIGKDSSAASGE